MLLLLLLLSRFSRVLLCGPIDGSPPGSPVPGILQARTLEWVAISFSNAGKRKVKVMSLSHVRLLATPWTTVYQAPPSMGFSRQDVSCSVMSNSCDLMDCSPPGSSVHGILQLRILEWAAISFSWGPSRPRDQTRVSCIAGRFFTTTPTWEAAIQDKKIKEKKGHVVVQRTAAGAEVGREMIRSSRRQ